MSNGLTYFTNLNTIATHFREILEQKKYILLFAYNGIGKTRLSMAFKDQGKTDDTGDTLYFNAFTEDLFSWDNDLEKDSHRVLRLNQESRFFGGLESLEMENRIGPLLARYADFDFRIDCTSWEITFYRGADDNNEPVPIKISRGEENIFIWCFFLAVAQLAIDAEENTAYSWVKYIYVDDPISSLDDNHAIAVASHLAQLLMSTNGKIKAVISSHHALFFNVVWNELNERGRNNPLQPFFLSSDNDQSGYTLRYTNSTPFFHHVALLQQLHEAAESNQLYTYHFNILRNILEKTATFHGFKNFSACIERDKNDEDGIMHARMTNVLSHGNYSLYEPREMLEENKEYFKKILKGFMKNHRFNPELFRSSENEAAT